MTATNSETLSRPARAGAARSLLRWRLIVDPPLAGALNMARDHALASTLQPGEAVLRLYRWAEPTVSFGRNEPAAGLYDRALARERGVAFVRRPTGGRAVLHDGELTYAVVVPLGSLGSVRGTFQVIGRGLVRALRPLGVDAQMARPDVRRAAPLDGGPCFGRPAADEIVVGGRKLVGSAQMRVGRALLQHGSLLVRSGQELVDDLRWHGRKVEPEPRSVSLSELLEPLPDWDWLAREVAQRLLRELGGRALRREAPGPSCDPKHEAELRGLYASEAWTWRR